MDAYHFIGNDLVLSPTGDLQTVDADDEVQQRILRRLITAPGAYLWHLEYGAGVGEFVGSPAIADEIKARIGAQMILEEGVSHSPAPIVTAKEIIGGVFCDLKYWDAQASKLKTLSFNANF